MRKQKQDFDNLNVDELERIPAVSSYNHNYYKSGTSLLFGESDDDYTTEWFWIRGKETVYLGESYTHETPEVIHLYDSIRT